MHQKSWNLVKQAQQADRQPDQHGSDAHIQKVVEERIHDFPFGFLFNGAIVSIVFPDEMGTLFAVTLNDAAQHCHFFICQLSFLKKRRKKGLPGTLKQLPDQCIRLRLLHLFP